jgi:AraC-like DNA-binding protein
MADVLDPALIAVTDVMATLPNVMFAVKAVDGTYAWANQAFADRAGVAAPGDVVGRRAGDLFPAELAERYEAQDTEILRTGHVLTNELEVITRPDGTFGWFLSSKSRWLDQHGRPAGLVTASTDLRTSADAFAPHARLAAAVDLARQRFAEPLRVADLAEAAGMTSTQLERSLRKVASITPKQLIMRFRLEEALRLLTTTDMPIAEVAAACGYYDQSAFHRNFRRAVGHPPGRYRADTEPA